MLSVVKHGAARPSGGQALLLAAITFIFDTFGGIVLYGAARTISHRHDIFYHRKSLVDALTPRSAHELVLIVLVILAARLVGAIAHEAGHVAMVRRYGGTVTQVVLGLPVVATFTVKGVRIRVGALPSASGISWRPALSPSQRARMTWAGVHMHAVLAVIGLVAASRLTGSAAYLSIVAAGVNIDMWLQSWRIERSADRKAASQSATNMTGTRSANDLLSVARKKSEDGESRPVLAMLERLIPMPTCAGIRTALQAEHAMHLSRAGRFAESAREFSEIASAATAVAVPTQARFNDDVVCEAAFDDDRAAIVATSRQGWADAVLCAALCDGLALDAPTLERCGALCDGLALDAPTLERCATILEFPTYLAAESYAAHQHSLALLRIAQGRPADAVALIRQSREHVRAVADRAIVDATMVIALADLGETAQARLWLEQTPPHSALWRAASARLAAAEKRATPSWAR